MGGSQKLFPCVYGHYLPVLREVSRYLGIHFDNAHEQGIYSL